MENHSGILTNRVPRDFEAGNVYLNKLAYRLTTGYVQVWEALWTPEPLPKRIRGYDTA